MAVVQVIENGGARLEVEALGECKFATISIEVSVEKFTIDLDADDLKALIKRCKVVLAQLEG
jgi:hypothetical protein